MRCESSNKHVSQRALYFYATHSLADSLGISLSPLVDEQLVISRVSFEFGKGFLKFFF